jgi:hypothetical protein
VNSNTVKLAVVEGNTINQSIDLREARSGAAAKIRAFKGAKFILADKDTGFAPENLTVRRVGKDLHLGLQGTDYDQPQLIIEEFYGNEGSLIGLGEDGAYHQYIALDAQVFGAPYSAVPDLVSRQAQLVYYRPAVSGGSPAQIDMQSAGNTDLVVENCCDGSMEQRIACYAPNRRVVVRAEMSRPN